MIRFLQGSESGLLLHSLWARSADGAFGRAHFFACERVGRAPPECRNSTVHSESLQLIDQRTVSSSVPPHYTSQSLGAPTPPALHNIQTTSILHSLSARHDIYFSRTDEDEQNMPDGTRHLFGILYSGHLLFPKYVPTR